MFSALGLPSQGLSMFGAARQRPLSLFAPATFSNRDYRPVSVAHAWQPNTRGSSRPCLLEEKGVWMPSRRLRPMRSSSYLKLLVTGSAGLIGSEAVRHFSQRGWRVHGIDNNMRADFFGKDGDTTWNLERLKRDVPTYSHYNVDI